MSKKLEVCSSMWVILHWCRSHSRLLILGNSCPNILQRGFTQYIGGFPPGIQYSVNTRATLRLSICYPLTSSTPFLVIYSHVFYMISCIQVYLAPSRLFPQVTCNFDSSGGIVFLDLQAYSITGRILLLIRWAFATKSSLGSLKSAVNFPKCNPACSSLPPI